MATFRFVLGFSITWPVTSGALAANARMNGITLADRDRKGPGMNKPRGLRQLICRTTAVAATFFGVASLSVQ
jgi:hypothetical protein